MTVEEFVRQEQSAGAGVHRTDGVWWKQAQPGFYIAVPLWQPLSPGRARPLWTKSWAAYQHAVPDSVQGNAMEGVMVLRDHRGYSLEGLSANRRSKVRRGLRRVEIRRIPDVETLVHDGFRVYCSALTRQRRRGRRATDHRRWEAAIRATFGLPGREDWGAFDHGRMVAYLRAYLLEDTMFIGAAMSDTDALGLYPNDALLHGFLESCRDRSDVQRIMHSFWSGKASLDQFKLAFGFEVVRLPVYRWIHPVARTFLRLFPYRSYLDYDRHNVETAPLHAIRD